MGRRKQFNRVSVLTDAMGVFKQKGFRATTITDLERGTGVDRSGLYSEFADKEDIFVCALDHYIKTADFDTPLLSAPLGWGNIERFLVSVTLNLTDPLSFLTVHPDNEGNPPSAAAQDLLAEHYESRMGLIATNLRAVHDDLDAAEVAGTILAFYLGIKTQYALKGEPESTVRQVEVFLKQLRSSL